VLLYACISCGPRSFMSGSSEADENRKSAVKVPWPEVFASPKVGETRKSLEVLRCHISPEAVNFSKDFVLGT
jgi:hypothetical protein